MSRIPATPFAPSDSRGRVSDQLIAALKQRVASNYGLPPSSVSGMAGLVLDGAGQVKMETLLTCVNLHQRLHGLVETYALSVRSAKPEPSILNNIKRNLPILASKLKDQFGLLSDLVTSVYLSSSRGSSELMRVRAMREGVASIKMQFDIAVTQTIAKHKKLDH
jgi:hypothetical protein